MSEPLPLSNSPAAPASAARAPRSIAPNDLVVVMPTSKRPRISGSASVTIEESASDQNASAEAFKLLTEEEAAKLINEDELKVQALRNAEQNGIVFIDEIDKIARRQETMGADVSREGVQRDLLPLVEG